VFPFAQKQGGCAVVRVGVNRYVEQAFVFEKFKLEACKQNLGVGKVGDLVVIGFVKGKEGWSWFVCHLRGEDRMGEFSGDL
jgi:hypothetical protein